MNPADEPETDNVQDLLHFVDSEPVANCSLDALHVGGGRSVRYGVRFSGVFLSMLSPCELQYSHLFGVLFSFNCISFYPVSYTHLTLPTS